MSFHDKLNRSVNALMDGDERADRIAFWVGMGSAAFVAAMTLLAYLLYAPK